MIALKWVGETRILTNKGICEAGDIFEAEETMAQSLITQGLAIAYEPEPEQAPTGKNKKVKGE